METQTTQNQMSNWFPTIVDTLAENPDQGPLTESYNVDASKVIQVLNRALASEMMAWLSYKAQALAAEGIRAQVVIEEFEEHATQELEHVEMLTARIDELGGTPRLDPASIDTLSIHPFGGADTLEAMLAHQLKAERRAVEFYRDAIQWLGDRDPTTRRMLEDILAVEEHHANDLSGLMPCN